MTEADRAIEEAIRARLAAERPGDGDPRRGVRRERGRTRGAGSSTRSTATRNYSRGIPVWATLIALEEDGVGQLGVVSAPALGRRWWAERGGGAFADGEPIRVSASRRVEDAG